MKRKKRKLTFQRILALFMALFLTLGNFSSLDVRAQEGDPVTAVETETAEAPETIGEAEEADSASEDDQAEEAVEDEEEEAAEAADLEDSISEDVPEDGNLNEDEDSEEASDEGADKEDEDSSEKESEETVYEEQEFTGSTDEVSVYAKGVFPKGTIMRLQAVPKTVAIDAADKVVSEKVVDAVAVDITFYYTENGEEKEAVHQGTVDVRLTSFRQIEGEEHSAIHIEDDGRAEVVADAGASAAVVEAKSFSIYAIVGTEGDDIATDDTTVVTYNFYSKTKEELAVLSEAEKQAALLSVQKVKNNDILYMPEAPEREGSRLKGWFLEDGREFNSFGVVSGITKAGLSGKTEINVYPAFENVRFVFFYDAPKDNADKKIIRTKTGEKGDVIDLTDVQIGSLPSNQSVVGWLGEDGTLVTSLTLADENVNLYPVIKEGNYIYFESGEGASYVKPQFVPYGGVSVKPADPARKGYSLKGWTTDKNATDSSPLFNFGETLSSVVTLYAVWTPVEYANYTVIFWRQSVNDHKDADDSVKTYDYVAGETVVRTAKVGTRVSPEYKDTRKSIDQGYPNGSYRGFSYNGVNSKPVVVNADGNTVLNVYYDRDVLTINFHYGYKTESFKGLYGSRLSDNGYTWPSDIRWYNKNEKKYLTFLDAFIFDSISNDKKNINLEAQNNSNEATISHYKQGLSGSENDYHLENTTYSSGGNFYFSNKYRGFTLSEYRTGKKKWFSTKINWSNWKTANIGGWAGDYEYLEIRYTRNSYKLEYDYVVGNVATPIAGYTETIKYEAPLSKASYNKPEPAKPQGVPANFIFTGWYKDKELTQKFSFNGTMPSNDIVVYAGWKAPTVTVTAYTSKDGGAVHKQFVIPYGSKVSKADLTDLPNVGDNTFIGWATKSNGTLTIYNFETRLYEDLELYPYFAGSAKYTVSYDLKDGKGEVKDSKKYMEGAEADVQSFKGATAPKGKVFIGWKYNEKIYLPQHKVAVTENITFTAEYANIPAKTSLRYNANYPAGSLVNPPDYAPVELQNLANNSRVKILDFDKTGFAKPNGYKFVGWKTLDGDRIFKPGETVIVDNLGGNVLYAEWERKEVLTVTVTGNSGEFEYDGTEKVVTGSSNNAADYSALTTITVTKKASAVEHEKVSGREVDTYYMVLDPKDYEASSSDPRYEVKIEVVDGYLKIDKNTSSKITITANDASKPYNGEPLSDKGFKTEGLPGGLKAEAVIEGSITHVYENAPKNNVVKTVKILDANGKDVTENFPNIKKVNGTLTITPAKLKLKGAVRSFLYDGAEHTDEIVDIVEGRLFGDDKIDVKALGTIRNIGTVPNPVGEVKFIVGKADDYTIEKEDGKLEVTANTQARVKVTAASRSKVYDGTPLTAPDGYKVDNLPQGLKAEAIIEGSITQVKESGTGNNVVKEVKIFDADNNDVTANFPNIDKVKGNLTITPAPITLTAASETFEYDGKVHTNENVTKVGEFAAVDEVTYRATGTIKDVGNKPNPVEVKFITGSEDNYDIECIPGTLKVTPNSTLQIKVKAKDATKQYDGTPLTESGFDTYGDLPDGFTVKAVVEGAVTHVYENAPENNVVKDVKIFDADGKDVTASFDNIDPVNGTLTITPAPVKFKLNDERLEYDGAYHRIEHTVKPEEIINGELYGGDEIYAWAVNEFEKVGTHTSDVDCMVENGSGKLSDYAITPLPVTLEIYKYGAENEDEFYIRAVDADKPYDGTALEDGRYDTNVKLPDPGNFRLVVKVDGSVTHVSEGEVPNKVTYQILKRETAMMMALSSATDTTDDEDWVDVTDNFYIKAIDGKLKITPRNATIETGSSRRTYNGSPLTNASYTPKGFLDFDLEEMTIRTTGSRTEVGSSSNTYEIEWGPVDKEDYKITDVLGTLTVDSVPTTPTPGPGPAPKPTPKPAPAPAATPAPVAGEVLGARRTDSEQVLGARKNTEGTVLGARRGKTGEESNSSRLMIMASLSALLVLLAGGGKKKKG